MGFTCISSASHVKYKSHVRIVEMAVFTCRIRCELDNLLLPCPLLPSPYPHPAFTLPLHCPTLPSPALTLLPPCPTQTSLSSACTPTIVTVMPANNPMAFQCQVQHAYTGFVRFKSCVPSSYLISGFVGLFCYLVLWTVQILCPCFLRLNLSAKLMCQLIVSLLRCATSHPKSHFSHYHIQDLTPTLRHLLLFARLAAAPSQPSPIAPPPSSAALSAPTISCPPDPAPQPDPCPYYRHNHL